MEQHKGNKADEKMKLNLTSAGKEVSYKLEKAPLSPLSNPEASKKIEEITVRPVLVGTPAPPKAKLIAPRLAGAARNQLTKMLAGGNSIDS